MRKYYSSISLLPIWNWNKIHETQNLNFLLLKDDYTQDIEEARKKTFEIYPYLIDAWRMIYNEFLSKYGLPKEYIRFLNAQEKICLLRLDAYLTGDKTKLTFAEIEAVKLKNLTNEKRAGDFMSSVIAIERKIGNFMDEKTISVDKFYAHLFDLKNG